MANPALEALNAKTLATIAATFAAPLKATDSRIDYCERLAASLKTEITQHGMAGAAQVFVSLASSQHWRMKRAQFLAQHRRSARDGWPKPAAMWMRKAMEARAEEQFRRGLEQARAAADTIEADIDLLQGRVAQNVDARLVAAVADAIGVTTLQAAE